MNAFPCAPMLLALVSGGSQNEARGTNSSVTGGQSLKAIGDFSWQPDAATPLGKIKRMMRSTDGLPLMAQISQRRAVTRAVNNTHQSLVTVMQLLFRERFLNDIQRSTATHYFKNTL